MNRRQLFKTLLLAPFAALAGKAVAAPPPPKSEWFWVFNSANGTCFRVLSHEPKPGEIIVPTEWTNRASWWLVSTGPMEKFSELHWTWKRQ